MTALQFHPLADIFPLVEGAEFDELVADIKLHGLHEPVVLFGGKVLDGRNRLRACEAANVAPTYTVYTGDDPVSYVVSLNLRRRHLNESQRAMVAAKLASLKLGDNQHSEGPSIEEASRLLNVGHASVERAKMVQRAGIPELVQSVEQGAVSVSAAAQVATQPIEEQREIVARGDREILQAAQAIRARKAEVRHAERIERLVHISGQNRLLPQTANIRSSMPIRRGTSMSTTMSGVDRAAGNHYPPWPSMTFARCRSRIWQPTTLCCSCGRPHRICKSRGASFRLGAFNTSATSSG